MDKIVSLKGVVKDFPIGKSRFRALKGVDLEFGKGEFTGFIGPSGSGKTTLLNIIGSLDSPTEGTAEVMGRKIEDLKGRESAKLRREHMGFIFQSYNLLPVYTVFENVEFPLIIMGMPEAERKKKVDDALEWLGLTDKAKSRPPQLSGGESQRVAIARAVVKRPQLVLADEPTANLDAENSYNILEMMLKLNEELDTTFLFATHDEKVIGYLKRKVFLVDGQVDKDIAAGGRE
jgi:putative ABC transport system ATP-binding protein